MAFFDDKPLNTSVVGVTTSRKLDVLGVLQLDAQGVAHLIKGNTLVCIAKLRALRLFPVQLRRVRAHDAFLRRDVSELPNANGHLTLLLNTPATIFTCASGLLVLHCHRAALGRGVGQGGPGWHGGDFSSLYMLF